MNSTRQRNANWDTRTLSVSGSRQRVARIRVEIIEGPDAGVMAASDGQEFTIGTARGNHLVVTDGAISRHHCTIRVDENGYLLEDLGSRNGTWLGGVRVVSAYLEPGVVLGIGESAMRFEVLGEEIEEQLAQETEFGQVVGESPPMRRIFALLERAAPTDTSILLEGETGSGKTMLARAIHERSERRDGPFLVIDCAALVPGLVESELFGHVRGAFTGADAGHTGLFEAAHGGTVFLDEIGELPPDLQPKLLRVLETRTVTRVGATSGKPIDVRVIAATNRDLRSAVNRGEFRADLYYRMSTLRIRVPPLRERPEDVPLLAARFYCEQTKSPTATLPPDLLRSVIRHSWPGNVRELKNFVDRAVLMGEASPETGTSEVEHDLSQTFRDAKKAAISHWERSYLKALMQAYRGNVSRASRSVKMDRNYLRDLLRRHDLDQKS